MAFIKQLPSGNFQLRVENKLLPKKFYSTFASRAEAESYGNRLEGLLKQGIVPPALLEKKEMPTSWMISRCIAEYVGTGEVKPSEIKLLDTIRPTMIHESTAGLGYNWCEAWVNRLKRENNLSPSTIRHRVGALKRCFDDIVRRHPEIMVFNPLTQLKRGFATYNEEDRRMLALSGKDIKVDEERDRRLHEDEEPRVLKVMESLPNEKTFFILALESAMRMREIFTIDVAQVSIAKKTIHLTKTKNGDNRQVPMSSVAISVINEYLHTQSDEIKARNGLIFPFWTGVRTEKDLDSATSDTSRKFRKIFSEAEVEDFVFHDLRHEATCRLFIKTTMSDLLIAKITGHKDIRTLKRYASLRGSDLAAMMW